MVTGVQTCALPIYELTSDSPRREFATLAKTEIDRLDKLVGEFLRFARPATLSIEPNDLNAIVKSVSSLLENQAAAQQVTIEKTLETDMPEVMADREQIKQVILNLAINSLQAMPKSGHIILRTYQSDVGCVFEIEDTGGGIESELLPKIFDPFFTTKDKGIGLGLSVAHKIVAQHNGKLKFRQGDDGSVFELELPPVTTSGKRALANVK